MGLSDDCFEYRSRYDKGVGAPGDVGAAYMPALLAHGETCSGCIAWRKQIDGIVESAAHMPQFDVSEQLTQSIMAAVEQQVKPQALVHFWLLLPVAVVCAALGFTVIPFDSIEGAASTAIGLVGIALFYLLVRAANTQELPA